MATPETACRYAARTCMHRCMAWRPHTADSRHSDSQTPAYSILLSLGSQNNRDIMRTRSHAQSIPLSTTKTLAPCRMCHTGLGVTEAHTRTASPQRVSEEQVRRPAIADNKNRNSANRRKTSCARPWTTQERLRRITTTITGSTCARIRLEEAHGTV